MQNLLLIGTITLIHFLALISPGPDFFMAIRNSLIYSRKTGIWTAIGFGLGISVHITYCLAGLAVIISQSILIFNTIKFLGAAYLLYIGIKSFMGKTISLEIEKTTKKKDITPLSAVKIGFLTNVLNPKATLFFLGLFTLVISPETPAITLFISSLMMIMTTMIWFSLVAILFTQKNIRSFFEKFQNIFNKVFGGLLIFLGIKVALSDK